MCNVDLVAPHGGFGLINRIIPDNETKAFLRRIASLKFLTLKDSDLSVFYRISDGTLSPLEGPMSGDEFYRVLDHEYIERNGKRYAWSIPIAFAITQEDKKDISIGENVCLKNESGGIIGTIEVSDIYYFDKPKYNRIVYGIDRTDHPGVRIVNNDGRDYLIGGKISALRNKAKYPFQKYILSPRQIRSLIKKRKWQRAVAFQTRNPLHRAHEYAMVYALESLIKEGYFAGAALNPLVGETKSDDVPAAVRMKTYEALIKGRWIGRGDRDEELLSSKRYDLTKNIILIALDMRMFYAGPKEAIMHAIYRQNCGFSDIIIGRRHADAPFDNGEQAWGDFDAQDKFEHLNGELLIKPVKVDTAAYFEELERVTLESAVAGKGYRKIEISGKELRKRLQQGGVIDERIMRKPVVDILRRFYQKRNGN